jgi:CheY-like chemotaxis protein/HPt (histidine-containing phosphotransfer) domain-containing protein
LTVNSEVGRGSIFTLTVPTGSLEGVRLAQRAEADVVPSAPKLDQRTLPTLPSCRILLVEDGVTNRKLISLVLERAGASVRCAENGQAGLETVAWEPFDLILMDMQMPVMDGYTATRELRRQGCTLPIIALTAHAMASDEKKCRESGCSGYLTKPIDRVQLLEAVAAALSGTEIAVAHKGFAAIQKRPEALRAPTTRVSACESPIASRLPADDPEFCEIIAEFVSQFDTKLVELGAAATAGDVRRVAEIAHWIKGAGGTAGFDDLTGPAAELERAAKEAQCDRLPPLVERLNSFASRLQVPVHP